MPHLPGEAIASETSTSGSGTIGTSILRSPATSSFRSAGVSLRFPEKQNSKDNDDEGVQNVADVVMVVPVPQASPKVFEPASPSVFGTPTAGPLLQPTTSSAYTRNRTVSESIPPIITPYSSDRSLRTARSTDGANSSFSDASGSSSGTSGSGGTTDTPTSVIPLYAASVQEAVVKHVVWSDDAGYPLCEVRIPISFFALRNRNRKSHVSPPPFPPFSFFSI